MAPSHALAFREGAAKRWQGCVQAGLLSREINEFGVLTLSKRRKATLLMALCASRRRAPRGRRTRACTSMFMGENREVPRLARGLDQWAGRSGNAEAVSLG